MENAAYLQRGIMSRHITDLPVELFLDNILPLLPVPDLLNLGCVNHHFAQITSDEAFWHRKIQDDFNFSGSETARKNGWKFLYSRLSHPHVFVWGYAQTSSHFVYLTQITSERSHGRLGVTERQLSHIRALQDSVPCPVRLRIPGVRIVSLIAGGW